MFKNITIKSALQAFAAVAVFGAFGAGLATADFWVAGKFAKNERIIDMCKGVTAPENRVMHHRPVSWCSMVLAQR